MAASKKKSKKIEQETPFFGLVSGWFLFAVGVILLLGCISSVYSGENGNWLGPFFGKLVPDTFTFVFGRLPVIFFTLSLVLWGLFIALKVLRPRLLSFSIGMTLLTLDLSCLLSLKSYGMTGLPREVLFSNGGVLGQFFMQYVFVSVFGTVSVVAPLIILVATLGLILVLSFGLRPRHFAFIAKTLKWFAGLFHKKNAEAPVADDVQASLTGREARKGRKDMLVDDSTIYSVPDGYNIRDKADIKPFKVRRGVMGMVGAKEDAAPFPYEKGLAENPYAPDVTTVAPPGFRGDDETVVAADQVTVAASEQEDPEILRLEQELRDGEGRMSALQIKEIRDKIAEIRRARDLLNWEKAHQNKIVVKGAVRGGEPQPEAEKPNPYTEETVVAARHGEDFAVDEPQEDENPVVEGNDEDETFMPEIVGADEVDRDPTYVPPNRIGTAESTGIPQLDPTVHYDEYKVPTVDEILDTHEPQPADYTEEELNEIGRMLEEKLENFKVKGKVVGCETGPVITRFEVEPGPGVKVSQFSSLQDDLAMALKATSIRILTPIPGKGAVGIEIPNRKTQTIYGRDIFESAAFKPSPDKIVMALGKDISGEPFAMDLAKAPHLMIAGQTGSGKSVCINALMASMLLSKTPDELRMILVDPKAVELKMYENIPHLLAPVITKPEVAIQALQWLCYEMDRRTEVLAKAKVRNINGFNEKFDAGELPEDVPEEDRGRRMAFIVVIIDEMADLMMVAGKEIEKNVSRLAAKARAVGIHLVLATQRPSVKVITGNIKANLPTRISFKVASQVDARTVMDHAGAEKLLGRGDMLYKAVNAPDPVRLHGAFLSDEEAEKLADACSNQNVCYPQLESFEVEGEGGEGEDGEGGNAAMNEKKDKLLFEVAKWAIECGNGLSTSAVQRHFSVGYSRAGKIVDQLFGMGLCARSTGNSKPRAMLIGMDELMQLERSGAFR
ncbi:DNA translocase FtsK [Fibrobacter sp. UBA4309]|uniref:DNA translocase FtsK n=1 Tax=Fibrobacter sp. UBA4309 TaxID=1946537 RepID=UPI0025BEEEBE|nr:DNA translocase FtsK [Fibrobacter sp. UBA4309]